MCKGRYLKFIEMESQLQSRVRLFQFCVLKGDSED